MFSFTNTTTDNNNEISVHNFTKSNLDFLVLAREGYYVYTLLLETSHASFHLSKDNADILPEHLALEFLDVCRMA